MRCRLAVVLCADSPAGPHEVKTCAQTLSNLCTDEDEPIAALGVVRAFASKLLHMVFGLTVCSDSCIYVPWSYSDDIGYHLMMATALQRLALAPHLPVGLSLPRRMVGQYNDNSEYHR